MSKTLVKICGLTCCEEAEYLNEYGSDFAGMVLFFPKSKRNITLEKAMEIMSVLDKGIKKVAVTVSPTLEQIRQITQAGFDYIQIHGSMDADILDNIDIPVLKAFNVSDMVDYEFYHSCPKVAGYIFDAAEYGSGKTFDWGLMKNIPKDEKMLFLAGGLNEENVADAVRIVRPDGVDVSSGVEFSGAMGKDPEKIRKFILNAKNA